MNSPARKSLRRWIGVLSIFLVSALSLSNTIVFAHGGEDHGDAKSTPVSNKNGTITRTARAGELEVMLKYAAIKPDTASTAQLFVTKYATNEPFPDAKSSIEITAPDGKTFEASEAKLDAPGSYSFKLPPLPQGNYTILARINAPDKTDTATFSSVSVAHPASDSATDTSSWLQTMAMVLTAFVVLSLFGGLMFFALRFAKRESVSEEVVSA